ASEVAALAGAGALGADAVRGEDVLQGGDVPARSGAALLGGGQEARVDVALGGERVEVVTQGEPPLAHHVGVDAAIELGELLDHVCSSPSLEEGDGGFVVAGGVNDGGPAGVLPGGGELAAGVGNELAVPDGELRGGLGGHDLAVEEDGGVPVGLDGGDGADGDASAAGDGAGGAEDDGVTDL